MTSRLPNLFGGAALLAAFAFGFANVATAQTITVSGCASFTTSGGTSANITITCNTGGGGATAPSCSGANIAAVGSPATSLTFTATCTQGTNPMTSVALNGTSQCSGANCTSPFPVSVPNIPVPAVTTNYTVTASDGTLTGSSTATYVVSGGGGGSVDLSGCTQAGFNDARWVDADYPNGANININYMFSKAQNAAGAKNGIFTNQSALVVRFTTPSVGVNDLASPNFQAEVGSNGARQATLGTAPCLVPTSNTSAPPVVKTLISQTPSFNAQIVPGGACNVSVWLCSGTTWLAPNTTYYITLVNKGSFSGPANTCTSSNCDMRWNFNN